MYESVLADGPAFYSQLLTFAALLLAGGFWIKVYFRSGRRRVLEVVLVPAALWFVFGTLDILTTAKGVYGNPFMERNVVARFMFAEFGFFGPALATLVWITLWALVSLTFDWGSKALPAGFRDFTQLMMFYSLAVGHLFAFGSWMGWQSGEWTLVHPFLSFMDDALGVPYLHYVFWGCFFAAVHGVLLFLCSRRMCL
ncbi:MAG: hypothetical protein NTU61_04735 [Candidatus Altiarchaeota archaeon]|nr:hypothetical protein [Candidatus Altiarchaeota archaeon]